MAEPYRFEKRARRPMGLAMVGVAILFLLVLVFGIRAHPAIVAIFVLLTAPAVWDVWRDAKSWLEVSETHIAWGVGARTGSVPLDAIEEVRTRTSLDFAQRATIVETRGVKHRIPMPCLPGNRHLDTALEARGVLVKRTLFGG